VGQIGVGILTVEGKDQVGVTTGNNDIDQVCLVIGVQVADDQAAVGSIVFPALENQCPVLVVQLVQDS